MPLVTIHMFFTSYFLTSPRVCLQEGRIALARVLTLPRRIFFLHNVITREVGNNTCLGIRYALISGKKKK